ncbi:AAA family ATPase [Litorivivens sp.]|uniref:AAA family ATPase n=1 Tax=Litorivivens sp. TaxID=2020868 RepID=UPI003568F9F0
MNDTHDLNLLLEARTPLIVLETFEEIRALQLLTRVAIKRASALHCWSVTDGINQLGFGQRIDDSRDLSDPEQALRAIKQQAQPALIALCDFHPYLTNPLIVRLVKDIALLDDKQRPTLVMISHQVKLPPELTRLAAYFSLSLPTDQQLEAIVREEARSWAGENSGHRVRTDQKTLTQLMTNLQGLSFEDSRRLIRNAIRDDGAIDESDLPEINRAKFQLMDMEGVLSFEYNTEKFSNVGGLHGLKDWLQQRKGAFLNANGTDKPKGVMLLGVQGGGKSLAAKAIAGVWGLPLLRLDFAALYNKYIGETEKNLREALQLSELMSPCVLWIDEIEKGLTNGQGDDGTSRRIQGTLLTWLSERSKPVFVCCTSNDISSLPPELVRKGRLDEIFFVDLPDESVRRDIFEIHLKKREQSPERFDLPLLSAASHGFSGAEIEQAIVSALYSCAAQDKTLDSASLLSAIEQTRPLSVVMAEKIQGLRDWAQGRTVAA